MNSLPEPVEPPARAAHPYPPRGGDIIDAPPSDNLILITHIIYLLHAVAVVTGVVGSATIVGSFLLGLPSVAAVILNYIKQGETRGTYLESHFRWQIRTFWFSALLMLIAAVLFLTIVGIPLTMALIFGTGIWIAYRVIRGWLALKDRKPIAPMR